MATTDTADTTDTAAGELSLSLTSRPRVLRSMPAAGGTKGDHSERGGNGGRRMTGTVRGGVPIKPLSTMLHEKFGLDLG